MKQIVLFVIVISSCRTFITESNGFAIKDITDRTSKRGPIYNIVFARQRRPQKLQNFNEEYLENTLSRQIGLESSRTRRSPQDHWPWEIPYPPEWIPDWGSRKHRKHHKRVWPDYKTYRTPYEDKTREKDHSF
ncbi:uncharacterized protein LOC116610158 [Nematostella vectensis]|uniref:uncharacterized protein LOC116610158 n=1 Tax=Nematostella vectensis TaxID=45351 RepID=UPI0020772B3F|nr:uncharacterized protein LOC116610158 [Nematostella vectensis]